MSAQLQAKIWNQSSATPVLLSKPGLAIFHVLAMIVILTGGPILLAAQEIGGSVRLVRETGKVMVEGAFVSDSENLRNLSFTNDAVGADELASRVSGLKLFDQIGNSIPFRRFGPGEFAAEGEIRTFSYEIDLTPLKDPRSDAHISWSTADRSLLLMDDLLPQPLGNRSGRARMSIVAEAKQDILTTETRMSDGRFDIADRRRAVVFLETGDESSVRAHRGRDLSVAVSGSWHFTDDEAFEMSDGVLRRYAERLGGHADGQKLVVLIRTSRLNVPSGTWDARTVGNTVIIVSSDMPSRNQSLQRLHEQLRHELFHLWVPNGLNLTGRYDWFYEGFALYFSLKNGVGMNRITFGDMLDTLGRAYEIDSRGARRSLFEVSNTRWSGGETSVYARGLMIAFLCDILLLNSSSGKTSIETILKRLFLEHRNAEKPKDGTAVVLELFDSYPALSSVVRNHIRGSEPVDRSEIFELAGLDLLRGTGGTRLQVKANLNGRQKAMLDRLGYNNWKKLKK